MSLAELIQRAPKALLHDHLDGGLRPETIIELAKSPDKTLAFIDGATHGYTTCKPCERTPGEFGDTQKTTYDFADKWLSKPGRFL